MDEMKEHSFNTQERLFYEQCNKNKVQVPDEYSSELKTKTVSSNEKMGYFDPKENTNITNRIQEMTNAKALPNIMYMVLNMREYPPYLKEKLNKREQSPVNLSTLPGSLSSRHKRKEKDPDTYNGVNVEWPDYICHFEQVAMWNEWTDQEKAAQLSICLRGNAQRVLSELTKSELSDYNKLRSALTQRFCPPERETAFRCEFRTRRRSRDESAAEYGYSLKRLASHAYPQIPMSMHKAISLAVEFEAFEGTQNSQYRKPKPDEAVNIYAVQNTHAFETNKNTHVEPSIWELADSVKAIQQTLANFTQGQQSDFNQGNNTRPRENKIPICYTCQKEGHISRNCPEAPYRRQDNNNYNRNRRANNQRQPQNTHSDDLK
ncbi:unnamed protein product [Mytilus edulis]|uniref:CCHC-type domain-containing protein n=1 Tax=Mytilus edulis TaxID=6550 RepID=A0A8S3UYK9_MYTED|nr:unnamed protein product [Mytilus edulis]